MDNSTLEQDEKRTRELIRDKGIEFVRIECEDINCVSRGFTLDVDFFIDNLKEGFGIPKGEWKGNVSNVDGRMNQTFLSLCQFVINFRRNLGSSKMIAIKIFGKSKKIC